MLRCDALSAIYDVREKAFRIQLRDTLLQDTGNVTVRAKLQAEEFIAKGVAIGKSPNLLLQTQNI